MGVIASIFVSSAFSTCQLIQSSEKSGNPDHPNINVNVTAPNSTLSSTAISDQIITRLNPELDRIGDKVNDIDEEVKSLIEILKAKEFKAPIVTVSPPNVTVSPGNVTVSPPSVTINATLKPPDTGAKTPDQSKPRNAIGLFNVNVERH
jgi:hypothetical protein